MLQPRSKSGYLAEDTIVAIATALGGALSIVRLSGPDSFRLLSQLSRSVNAEGSEPRKLTRSQFYDSGGRKLDDALSVCFPRPHSFTGEDVVELQVHGGSYIAPQIVEALIALGARLALPGEFSFRAVRNGKLTVFQAQAIADLISATNSSAVELALNKISGSQGVILGRLQKQIKEIAVLAEVGIDFSDQDLEETSLPRLKDRLLSLIDQLSQIEAGYEKGTRIQEGIRVALVGVPNVGKSSFFNALLGEDRSIVSEQAGTTRDIVHEKMTFQKDDVAISVRLEDTAGLRESDQVVETMGIQRTHQALVSADLIFWLVDSAQESSQGSSSQWRKIGSEELAKKTIGLITKWDLIDPSMRKEHFEGLVKALRANGISRWLPISSYTGEGISEVIDALLDYCKIHLSTQSNEVILTRQEQVTCVRQALADLRRAMQAPEVELFASDLRHGLNALGPLTQDTLPDDILTDIFSHFCIGK